MANKHDGSTAFPFASNCPGMSLRDWFAGQALASSPSAFTKSDAAERAYKIAIEMIKIKQIIEERERKSN